MSDILKCKDCKYFEPWRYYSEDIECRKLYSCGLLVIASPSPDDYCSKAEKVEKNSDPRWCNTCKFKHLESECLGCAEYDEYDNLIDLHNYKKEESDG